ncbi:MAG: hypothetical protein M3Q55_09645, partial [Acidobacteriota bacterium]|nr:hypothetical protein [Acidobacteriota bacterium]
PQLPEDAVRARAPVEWRIGGPEAKRPARKRLERGRKRGRQGAGVSDYDGRGAWGYHTRSARARPARWGAALP